MVYFFGLILVVYRSPLDVDPYHSSASNSHQRTLLMFYELCSYERKYESQYCHLRNT